MTDARVIVELKDFLDTAYEVKAQYMPCVEALVEATIKLSLLLGAMHEVSGQYWDINYDDFVNITHSEDPYLCSVFDEVNTYLHKGQTEIEDGFAALFNKIYPEAEMKPANTGVVNVRFDFDA